MAVTCSFKKSMGRAVMLSSTDQWVICDIYGGGNCLMVITQGKQHCLWTFFADVQHLRRCCKESDMASWIKSVELYPDQPYLGQIVKCLGEAGITCIIRRRPQK